MAVGALVASLTTTIPSAGAHPGHPHDETPPAGGLFEKVTLNDRPGEPMDLAVLPDNSVLHTTREGTIWYNDAKTGVNRVAGEIEVYRHDEEGLQSIALAPNFNFKSNNWVYLYYSPPLDTPVDDPETPAVNEGDAPYDGTTADWEAFKGAIRLSRMRFVNGRIDVSTEQQIMDVPVDRGICCHVGGDIVFDSKGNLILSTGDDTNPFFSDGYIPIDERDTRNPALDAQRTAANSNDLRGKLLRIKPKATGGGYTIPEGNLFAPGTPKTRPEIYSMGWRNPFRIEINPVTDDVLVADYSPDANAADPDRGPAGHGKWAIVKEASNFGWPYCATAELPYVDYDFATETSGETFDCSAPKNTSPHNTGIVDLPPVTQPDVWYSYGESAEFPELGEGGIGPMAGPVYQFDNAVARKPGSLAWPKYYDGTALLGEWTRDWVKAMDLDDNGDLAGIEDAIADIVTDNPMDMEFGSNGALYMLEYGDGYFAENPDAQLSRIDFVGENGNHSPVPAISADVTAGAPGLDVRFSAEGSSDPDGDRIRYSWDFDGDGTFDANGLRARHTFDEAGEYRVTLTVTERWIGSAAGKKTNIKHASADIDIVVGNQAPVVELVAPADGDTFSFGDTVAFEVQVTDDQPVDCSKVSVTYILGHDSHGHPQSTANGCTGTLVTTIPGGHDPATDNLSGVFVAEYTDPGLEGLPPLTGTDQVVLTPAG